MPGGAIPKFESINQSGKDQIESILKNKTWKVIDPNHLPVMFKWTNRICCWLGLGLLFFCNSFTVKIQFW